MRKRLEAAGVAPTDENRRAYRELLLTTPGLGEFISGVILFDETLRQLHRARCNSAARLGTYSETMEKA